MLDCVLKHCKRIEDIRFVLPLNLMEMVELLCSHPSLSEMLFSHYQVRRKAFWDVRAYVGCDDVQTFLELFKVNALRVSQHTMIDSSLDALMKRSADCLQVLVIRELNSVSDRMLQILIHKCPNLVQLEFSLCGNKRLANIFTEPNVLRTLKVWTVKSNNERFSVSDVIQVMLWCQSGNAFRFENAEWNSAEYKTFEHFLQQDEPRFKWVKCCLLDTLRQRAIHCVDGKLVDSELCDHTNSDADIIRKYQKLYLKSLTDSW